MTDGDDGDSDQRYYRCISPGPETEESVVHLCLLHDWIRSWYTHDLQGKYNYGINIIYP